MGFAIARQHMLFVLEATLHNSFGSIKICAKPLTRSAGTGVSCKLHMSCCDVRFFHFLQWQLVRARQNPCRRIEIVEKLQNHTDPKLFMPSTYH